MILLALTLPGIALAKADDPKVQKKAAAQTAPAQKTPAQKAAAQKSSDLPIIGCDAPAGHTCYFSISDAKGVTLAVITLPGGGRAQSTIRPEKGVSYVVVVDQNLANDRTCQSATKAGLFCKRDVLKPGFNN